MSKKSSDPLRVLHLDEQELRVSFDDADRPAASCKKCAEKNEFGFACFLGSISLSPPPSAAPVITKLTELAASLSLRPRRGTVSLSERVVPWIKAVTILFSNSQAGPYGASR